MEEGRMLKYELGYGTMLRIVGQFCDATKLDEITLIEFDKGIVLQGLQVQSTQDGYIRRMATYTWSYEELAAMDKQGKPQAG